MKTKYILPIALCCLCKAAASQEQQDSTDLYFRHLELDQVVVTGIAGDAKLKDTPSPIAVISSQTLQGKASANIINALASQPGVSEISTGPGISKPVIRGLGYNRVLVISDGIRQEGQQWGDEHGLEVDGAGVHSAEILKGPASLMYGSDALAGVLILHGSPIAPAGSFLADACTEYQSNNNLAAYSVHHGGNRGGVVWDLRWSDKYAGAYRNCYDGRVPNSGFQERAAHAMAGLNRSWGYSRLKLSLYHLRPGIVEGERDSVTGDLEDGATSWRAGLPFQTINHLKAVLDNSFLLPEGRLRAIVGWQRNVRKEFEESPDESGLHFLLNTLNYDVRYQSEIGSGWKLATGVGGMWQQSQNKGDEFLIPAYSLFDAGLFATLSHTVGAWTISGGLRGDARWLHSLEFEGRFEDFSRRFPGLTGSIGAVRPLGNNATVRVNVARGFRAPNLSELASNGEHEGTLRYELGNRNLRPEYSLQGDLGVDFFTKYVSGQIAVFCNSISNYIFLAATGGTEDGLPVFSYRSTDARLAGGEASIDVHPVHKLHLGGSFSYVRAAQKGGTTLPMIPAPRLRGEAKWEFTHDGKVLNNAFAAIDIDRFFAQNRVWSADGTETATPGYTLLGASAGTDVMYRGRKVLSIMLIGDNLLDTAFQNHLSRLKYADVNAVTGRMGVWGMGRNISLKVIIPVLNGF